MRTVCVAACSLLVALFVMPADWTSAAGAAPDSTGAVAQAPFEYRIAPTSPADAAPPLDVAAPWSYGATAASRYTFEGFDYSDSRPVLQPQAALAWSGFSIAFWGNMDLDRFELNESDLTVQQTFEAGAIAMTAGLVDLRYPHREGWATTHEVFADLAWDVPFSPSVSIHQDFDAATGSYITFSLSRSIGIAPAAATLTTRLFSQHRYYGMTGIPAAELNLGTELALAGLTVAPSISRFFTWENGTFRDEAALEPSWLFAVSVTRGQ